MESLQKISTLLRIEQILPCLALLGILVLMGILSNRSNNRTKRDYQKFLQTRNATYFVAIPHVIGLPIPEKTVCQVFSVPSDIEILANGQQFNLAKEKLINISMTSNTEIQKHYVSSAGGAVGGALLFGPLGALIGGRIKEKKITEFNHYLVFTYQKDEEPQYIVFDATTVYMKANKFVEEFKYRSDRQTVQIDL